MIDGVTIEQLRTLRAVAQEGSFTAAARKLGRVQAAVSQAIDRLEAQLGLRLFDRTSRTPRLTPHGEAVVAAADRIHAEIDALDALVARLKHGGETELSIVLDAMFPASALVAFAREFADAHPGVALRVFTEALSAVSAQVRARRATLGVAGEETDLTDLEQRHIANIRLLPVAAPQHPLARGHSPLDAAALADAVQVVLSERTRDDDGTVTVDRGVFSRRTWHVVDLATKHALLVAGMGWGHMPEHLVRDDIRAGRLLELQLDAWGAEPPHRGLALVRRRGTTLGPVAQWAESKLTARCREVVGLEPRAAGEGGDHTA